MTAPYFIYPVIKELETCTDAARREKLKMLIAANVSSPEALAKRIDGLDFRSMLAADDTPHSAQDDTIDRLLRSRLRGVEVDRAALKRASDFLLRKGYGWDEIQSALARYHIEEDY